MRCSLLAKNAIFRVRESGQIISRQVWATDISYIDICFSAGGECTAAIVKTLDATKEEILVQVYSFTSTPIAAALVRAHKRGINVQVILDKSQKKMAIHQPPF